MNQHIMYVVKNDAGEYLTQASDDRGYVLDVYEYDPVLAPDDMYLSVDKARELAEEYGGQVYQVTLTISDTPVIA